MVNSKPPSAMGNKPRRSEATEDWAAIMVTEVPSEPASAVALTPALAEALVEALVEALAELAPLLPSAEDLVDIQLEVSEAPSQEQFHTAEAALALLISLGSNFSSCWFYQKIKYHVFIQPAFMTT